MLASVLLTPELHYQRIVELIALNPISIDILTYSVGLVEHEVEWDGHVQTLPNRLGIVLELLDQKVKSRIIKQVRLIATVPPGLDVVAKYPNMKWRGHCSTHAKAWIFTFRKSQVGIGNMTPVALVGSRNLTISQWTEITVDIRGKQVEPLVSLFDALWKQGTNLAEDQDWFGQGQKLLEQSDGDII